MNHKMIDLRRPSTDVYEKCEFYYSSKETEIIGWQLRHLMVDKLRSWAAVE